jgi:hypothetical protein
MTNVRDSVCCRRRRTAAAGRTEFGEHPGAELTSHTRSSGDVKMCCTGHRHGAWSTATRGHRGICRARTRVAPDREGAVGGDRGQCKVRSRVCSGDRCLQRGLGLASGGERDGVGGAAHGRRYACPETLVATALIAIFQRSGLVGAVLRALATRALASRRRACVAIRLRFSRACGSRRHGS